MSITTASTPLTAIEARAHPPNTTDHGVNATTFHALWSNDDDRVDATTLAEDGAPRATLANGTDIPLNTPPKAVERWNRGDHTEFPGTDREQSIHPPDADLEDGRFIEDAYVEIFAVQPSTRARISSTDQPLYVASEGSVLGTADYRIDVPADDTVGNRRTFWTLQSHRIVETRLEVDSNVEDRDGGTHTPSLQYSSLDDYPGETHTLSLVTEIEVDFEKRIETKQSRCRTINNSTTCWSWWNEDYTHPSESITVENSIDVVEYDLSVIGFTATYPNGDFGLVVYRDRPWLGYSLPGGTVHGVWRFYAARDTDWDTLVRSTASGTTRNHSSLHSLQVHAYPIETGPTASPRRTISILETYGTTTDPPALPSNVNLDVLTEPYTASYGIATRTRTEDHDPSQVTAYGLVRGVSVQASESDLAEVPINRSELTLSVLNATDGTVTVRVRLVDEATNTPINTIERDDYVVLAGERVNTTDNGTVTRTLPRSVDGISARYEPSPWWEEIPGYVGDSDVVYVRGTVLHLISILYRIAVPVSLFLLGVFIIDRFTGSRIWPPWRGM